MKQPYLILRILLLGVAATHLAVGTVGMLPAIPLSVGMAFYGATKVDMNPQFQHVLQMYGAYMFAIGIMAVFAFWNPVKNKAIIYGVILLLLVRVVQRLFFFEQANAVFGISTTYYWLQTTWFVILAACLFLLRPKTSEQAEGLVKGS